ncbi:MAG TPA: DUF2723 domain-containing protein [Bdellovibrionota bacterium]|nr:DUF2723 domain-containing protein [Bdellovibrionota bacterium]
MSLLAFILLFALLVGSIVPYPGWFDAGELATAAHVLGVSHPSGHPAYLMVAKFFTFVPVGPIAFRIALSSAAAGILAAGLIFKWIVELEDEIRGGAPSSAAEISALCAGILILLVPSFAVQVIRCEVYALQTALSLGILLTCQRSLLRTDVRWTWLACFGFGVGMALQPLLTVVLAPAILFVALMNRKARWKAPGGGLLFSILGLAVVLYSPLRAVTDPSINWDAPVTLRRFWAAFTALDFRVFFHSPLNERAKADLQSASLWMVFTPALLACSVFGWIELWLHRKRMYAIWMFIVLFSALLPGFLKDFYLKNPDSHAYVALPIAIGLVLSTVGIQGFLRRLRLRDPLSTWVTVGVILGLMWPAIRKGPVTWRSEAGVEAEILSRHLDYAPAAGTIRVGSDHWLFPLWYRTYVEHRRPDVEIIGEGLMEAGWYRKQLAVRYGEERKENVWTETRRDSSNVQSVGYLLNQQGGNLPLRQEFARACAAGRRNDPMEIRGSICAHVVSTAFSALENAAPNPRAGLPFLEEYFGIHSNPRPCEMRERVKLPYPLARDRVSDFLMEPARVRTTLALYYLQCGWHAQALSLLSDSFDANDLDATLLRAFIYLSTGRTVQAQEELAQVRTFDQPRKGILAVAKSTTWFLSGERSKASMEYERARKLLGENDAAVQNLKKQFLID